MRRASRFGIGVLVLLVALGGFVVYFYPVRRFDRFWGELGGVERPLSYYMSDHGDWPDDINVLVDSGYASTDPDGSWLVPLKAGHESWDSSADAFEIGHPGAFEIVRVNATSRESL